jgi:hypothetical protein
MRKLLTSFFFLFALTGAAMAAEVDEDLITNQRTAIQIGAAIMEGLMGKARFDAMVKDAPLKAHLVGDHWLVYSWPTDLGILKHHSDGTTSIKVMAGTGDSPTLTISKHDGQVTDISYAK